MVDVAHRIHSIDYAHNIRPYLQLPHLLSLTWLAYPILSLIFIVFRIYFMAENRRRDRLQAKTTAEEVAENTESKVAKALAESKAAESKAVVEMTEEVDGARGANVDINATAFADLTDFENLK